MPTIINAHDRRSPGVVNRKPALQRAKPGGLCLTAVNGLWLIWVLFDFPQTLGILTRVRRKELHTLRFFDFLAVPLRDWPSTNPTPKELSPIN